MPAGSPERRISGIPAIRAKSAPAAAASASETRRSSLRVAQEREHRRQDEVLLLGAEGEDPRQVGADGDEADVSEREDARVADEDVERDDDRGVDERVVELELAHRGRAASRARRGEHERTGTGERDGRVEPALSHPLRGGPRRSRTGRAAVRAARR